MPAKQDEDVLDLLSLLFHTVKAQLQASLREDADALTMMEMRALNFFVKHPGSTQNDLVQFSGRDKAQITRTVKGMLDRDLLRLEQNAADRRCNHVHLTEAGKQVHKTVQRHRRRLAHQMMQHVGDSERERIADLLTRMHSNLDQESP